MNTIENDKSLTLSAHFKPLKQITEPSTFSEGGGAKQTEGLKPATQENLNLSATGQFLNQSTVNEPEATRSALESSEQAGALLSTLRQQFEQSGVAALTAHNAVRHKQLELLLRSAPA